MRIWDPHGWNAKLGEWFRLPDRDEIVGYQTIRLKHLRRDKYELEAIGTGPLGPAHAKVYFDSQAGRRFRFRLDSEGRLPRHAPVIATPGEEFVLHGPRGRPVFKIHAPRVEEFLGGDHAAGGLAEQLRASLFEPGGFQGSLGDCWVLASVAAVVAVAPEHVAEGLGARDGRAGVRLFDYDGEAHRYVPVSYLVDGHFPHGVVGTLKSCAEDGRATHYSDGVEGPDPHFWLRLLEKAMASRRGSYRGLDGGNPKHGLEALLGAPATEHDLSALTTVELEALLRRVQGEKLPVVLGSGVRLIPRLKNVHAYAIRQITTTERGELKVELFDPRGLHHPTLSARQLKDWAGHLWIGERPQASAR